MRVLPSRWWSTLICGAVGAVGGLFVGGGPALAGDASGLVTPIVVGTVLGVVVGLVLLLVALPNDSRLLAVRDRFPNALVVQSVRNDDTVVAISSLGGYAFNDLTLSSQFTFAFDRAGFTAWTGGRAPVQVGGVSWSQVTEFKLGGMWTSKASRSNTYHLLRIVVSSDNGPIALQFGVQRDGAVPYGRPYMNESELVDLIARISALRQGAVAATNVVSSNVSAGLVPGRTAWAASRVGGLPLLTLLTVGQVFWVTGALSILFKWPLFATVMLFGLAAIAIAFFIIGGRLQLAAGKREAAAGYTTLNGVNLAVEQRHPLTGVVIRAAGAQALSKAAFADLLRR